MRGTLFCTWPEMPVRHVGPGHSRTDPIESIDTYVLLEDGTRFDMTLRIEATDVWRKKLRDVAQDEGEPQEDANGVIVLIKGLYQVDPCTAYTPSQDLTEPHASFAIPQEPCDLAYSAQDHFHMIAREVKSPGTIELPNGLKAAGDLTLPDAISKGQGAGVCLVGEVSSQDVFDFQ
jgi:hypothetical protein